jgi:hypothetical protein
MSSDEIRATRRSNAIRRLSLSSAHLRSCSMRSAMIMLAQVAVIGSSSVSSASS